VLRVELNIKADILIRLDAQQCRAIADGITAVTGLSVRLILRPTIYDSRSRRNALGFQHHERQI
jgi:hypothetical protein